MKRFDQGLTIHIIVCVHEISAGASKTKYWDWNSVYFRCILRCDEYKVISMYFGVSHIYNLCHYIHLHYPSISLHLLSLLEHTLGGHVVAIFEMQFETKMQGSPVCTLTPWTREVGEACGVWKRVNWDIHFEAVIKCVGRLHFEAMIDQVRWSSWRRLNLTQLIQRQLIRRPAMWMQWIWRW